MKYGVVIGVGSTSKLIKAVSCLISILNVVYCSFSSVSGSYLFQSNTSTRIKVLCAVDVKVDSELTVLMSGIVVQYNQITGLCDSTRRVAEHTKPAGS